MFFVDNNYTLFLKDFQYFCSIICVNDHTFRQ